MNKQKSMPAGGREFRFALTSATAFAAAYTLLCFLVTFYLPEREPWRTVWMVGGMVMGLAAAAAVLLAWMAALRRRSPALKDFREFLRQAASPGHLLLIAWFLWACAACLLAAREGLGSLRHNSSYLFDLAVSLLVLFPLGYWYGRRGDLRLLHVLIDTAAVLLAVLAVFSLHIVFHPLETQWDVIQGVFLGRVFDYRFSRLAMAANPNTTGAYCAFFLLLAVYRIAGVKNRAGKILYGLFLALLAVILWKSGSRTSLLTAAAGTVFLLAGAALRKGNLQSSPAVRGLAILGGVVFVAVLALFLRKGSASAPFALASRAAAWLFRRDGRAATTATLGNRTPIWDAVVGALQQDRHLLLHGCSPASVIGTVQALVGEPYYTHNQFLEILLGQGLPAAILFTVWLAWLGRRGYSLFERSGCSWILGALLLSLLVGNLAEAMLTCLQHYLGGLFFLAAGYAGGLAADPENA